MVFATQPKNPEYALPTQPLKPVKPTKPPRGSANTGEHSGYDGPGRHGRERGSQGEARYAYYHQTVAYGQLPSHPAWLGYLFWVIGFTGAHRFYYGRPLTGILWFFTGGLFLIGWIVDLFLIPSMADTASRRYPIGRYDYVVAWLLHIFLGLFGIHRLYLGKIVTGVLWLLTGGLFGLGFVYDTLTLNDQIDDRNRPQFL